MQIRSRPSVAQWLLFGLSAVALLVAFGWHTASSRHTLLEYERDRLATQIRVIDDNLARQLAATHQVLDSIRRDLPSLREDGEEVYAIGRRLHTMREAMPGIRALTIFNAQGVIVSRSPDQFVGQNFAERDYFRIARAGGQFSLLYVAPPFLAATGEYVLNVVKVLRDGNGSFSGIVLASLDPEYFKTLLESVRYAPDMSVGIAHGEGKLFLLAPSVQGREGTDLMRQDSVFAQHRNSGLKSMTSLDRPDFDGRPSVVALRTVSPREVPMDRPLVLIASRPNDMILAHWRNSFEKQALLLALLLLTSAAALAMHQRRQQAYRRLSEARDAERRQAETDLRIADAAFNAQEGMFVTDRDGTILRVNRGMIDNTGFAATELVGHTPRVLKSGRHDETFYREMWAALKSQGQWRGEIWGRRKNGEMYPKWLTISAVRNEIGEITHYVGTQFDITERKQAEERIKDLAFYDQLTRLPNRSLLRDRLRQAMAAGTRSRCHGALLLIDLDDFKQINDTQGHHAGDLLLRQVASRLNLSVREEDTVARLGGDEFVIVLTGLGVVAEQAAKKAEFIAEKVLASLGAPFEFGDRAHTCTASIGVALFRGQEVAADDLMKQADLTMYKAKAAGRNLVRFFDPAMAAAALRRSELEAALRIALQESQFALYFQPQVRDDGRVVGAEALVRWRHPVRGIVSPAEFIPLAEETGLILGLGEWVLDTACKTLAQWERRPETSALTLAVNVSAHQFRQPDFVDRVLAAVEANGADPRRLKLELTESVLVENVAEVSGKMIALKQRGIGFSMDDFGTGYSSLAYLKRLPLEQLKIDRSFVDDVLIDPNDATIARTIIALAHNLGLGVIAEGVETAGQRDFLAAAGCRSYQGYLFGRPVPGAEFVGALTASDASMPANGTACGVS